MIDHEKYLVPSNLEIIKAIEKLNNLKHKVLFILDFSGKLMGSISDGDIRRWIIKSNKKTAKCSEIMNEECIYSKKKDLAKAQKKALSKGVSLIPIVDSEMIVIGVYESSFLLTEKKKNTILIMAGGKGTRLLPLTENVPKPMIEVGGKPIIERIIEKLLREGFENIVLSLGHLSNVIENYISNSEFKDNISFIKEDKPLGTAGALSNIDIEKTNFPILVTNGDILCECNLSSVIEKAESENYDGIMLCKEENFTFPFGVVECKDQQWLGIKEKPTFQYKVNAGIYVLSEKIIKLVNKNDFLDMPKLFEIAKNNKLKLGIECTNQYWIDIGRHETLNSANNYFQS